MYDEATVSAWFREQADLADHQLREDPHASGVESILARSCVYSYLYDRYFLETKDLLVNELRWLRKGGRPRAPVHAQSVESFNAARDALLDELIARFEVG